MDKDWISKIKIGDILLTKAGNPRTVLNVTRNKKGKNLIISVKKLQKNPVYHNERTSYTSSDLRYMGYRHSGVRVKQLNQNEENNEN